MTKVVHNVKIGLTIADVESAIENGTTIEAQCGALWVPKVRGHETQGLPFCGDCHIIFCDRFINLQNEYMHTLNMLLLSNEQLRSMSFKLNAYEATIKRFVEEDYYILWLQGGSYHIPQFKGLFSDKETAIKAIPLWARNRETYVDRSGQSRYGTDVIYYYVESVQLDPEGD